ncbi:MAG: hypothetical protein C4B58_05175 [Deltaproteobacteria bacterium]|nr:MAG: hypothetical protein C4B58_05175 [Deltaproteobacteria bacterium]
MSFPKSVITRIFSLDNFTQVILSGIWIITNDKATVTVQRFRVYRKSEPLIRGIGRVTLNGEL